MKQQNEGRRGKKSVSLKLEQIREVRYFTTVSALLVLVKY